jgi:hypothetical protein
MGVGPAAGDSALDRDSRALETLVPVTPPRSVVKTWWSVVPLVLPALHLCLCIATRVGLLASEGSWSWFLVFLVDFPFSVLLLPLLKIADPLLVFGPLGTAWWFLISKLGVYAVRQAANYRRKG